MLNVGVRNANETNAVSEYLEWSDLLNCRGVCQWWNDIFSSELFWKRRFVRHFGEPSVEVSQQRNQQQQQHLFIVNPIVVIFICSSL